MSIYVPPFQKQLDGTRCGGSNCSPRSHAMAAMRDRQGVNPKKTSAPWQPTGNFIRDKVTPYSCDSTNLVAKIADVLYKYYGITFRQAGVISWSDAVSLIVAGRGMTTAIRYSVLHGTRFDACPGFNGNHRIYVNQRAYFAAGAVYGGSAAGYYFRVGDPLADGRWLYSIGKYAPHGYKWWPASLLKKACGATILYVGGSALGSGSVFGNFTHDTVP